MIVLILNINVQTELVVRLLKENLVVAHMKVKKFQKEIVVSSIFQKNNSIISALASKKWSNKKRHFIILNSL